MNYDTKEVLEAKLSACRENLKNAYNENEALRAKLDNCRSKANEYKAREDCYQSSERRLAEENSSLRAELAALKERNANLRINYEQLEFKHECLDSVGPVNIVKCSGCKSLKEEASRLKKAIVTAIDVEGLPQTAFDVLDRQVNIFKNPTEEHEDQQKLFT